MMDIPRRFYPPWNIEWNMWYPILKIFDLKLLDADATDVTGLNRAHYRKTIFIRPGIWNIDLWKFIFRILPYDPSSCKAIYYPLSLRVGWHIQIIIFSDNNVYNFIGFGKVWFAFKNYQNVHIHCFWRWSSFINWNPHHNYSLFWCFLEITLFKVYLTT